MILSELLDGDHYLVNWPGIGQFTFRLLTLREYQKISVLRSSGYFFLDELEQQVFDMCYIGNSALLSADMVAGVHISIGRLILYMSGDCDTKTIINDISLERKRNPPDTLHEYMRAVVIAAFPCYSLEEIESWSRVEFIKRFCISENVLKKKDANYEFLDLSKIGKEAKPKKQSHGIDFAAENAAIMRNQNPMDVEETMNKLSLEQAKKLDSRRK